MSLASRIVDRIIGPLVEQRVQMALQVVDDAYWRSLTQAPKGQPWHQTAATIDDAERLYRTNPLGARIIEIAAAFVVGKGVEVSGPPAVMAFWDDPRNDFPARLHRWYVEWAVTGDLFPVLTTNTATRAHFVREVPSSTIDQIETDPDDLERPVRYHQNTADVDGRWWPAAHPLDLDRAAHDQVMLHFPLNRITGAIRGVSDFAAVTKWLDRYDLWLEDRVRINRYKGAYLWHVAIANAIPGVIEAKRKQYATIPQSGSIIVTDANETWTPVQPQISAEDVEADGRALRIMIAAGAGIPLHFLAEPDDSNRATAREMSLPTLKHFLHRQTAFVALVTTVLQHVARRAGEDPAAVRVTPDDLLAQALEAVADKDAQEEDNARE